MPMASVYSKCSVFWYCFWPWSQKGARRRAFRIFDPKRELGVDLFAFFDPKRELGVDLSAFFDPKRELGVDLFAFFDQKSPKERPQTLKFDQKINAETSTPSSLFGQKAN